MTRSLRVVTSTAFRAPTVGGNLLLTPEEADITVVGIVYEPSFVEGLFLTVDFYDISITNAMDTVDSNYVANQCLSGSGQKINADTALCQSADIAINGTGSITFNNGNQNVGGQATAGYEIRYISEMNSFSCLDAPSGCYSPTVDSMIYYNVTASYYLNYMVTFSGGINNSLDEDAPYYSGNNG